MEGHKVYHKHKVHKKFKSDNAADGYTLEKGDFIEEVHDQPSNIAMLNEHAHNSGIGYFEPAETTEVEPKSTKKEKNK